MPLYATTTNRHSRHHHDHQHTLRVANGRNPGTAVRYINHICGTEVQRRRIDDNYVVSGRIDVAAESLRERRMAAINNDVIMDITAHTKAWAVPIGYYDEVPNLVN